MQLILKIVLGIVGLIVLALGGLGVYLSMFFDPNEYKGVIEEQALAQANLQLDIEGDLGWSVFPWLGLEIGRVTVAIPGDLGGEPLAEVNAVQVAVKLMPLLSGAIEVNGILVDGLRARLAVDQGGQGNWEKLGGSADGASTTAADTDPGATSSGTSELPPLSIARLQIKNGAVQFKDAQAGQEVQLQDLQLSAENVKLGVPFPLDLAFSLVLADPQVQIQAKMTAQIMANPATEQYAITDLKYTSKVSGAPLSGKTVDVGLGGNVSANLKQQEAKLEGFYVTAGDLRANLGLHVTQMLEQPGIDGRIDIPAFNLKQVLVQMGQAAVDTTDAAALTQVGAGFNLRLAGDNASFENLQLAVDETRIDGTARLNTKTQAVFFRLKADEMNVDRYAPPAAEGAATGDSTGNASAGAAADAQLIPVESLRELNIDGEFSLQKLIASNLTIENIVLKILAKDGIVDLQKASGKLYEGEFASTARVNVRGKTPLVHVTKKLTSVNLEPLLKDLSNEERVAGKINLDGDFTTAGNTQQAILQSLGGNAQLKLVDGEVRGINVSALACKGLARANKQELNTSTWPATTSLDSLAGSMKFINGVGSNNDLIIETGGARITGEGSIDLGAESLDYRTQIKMVGKQLGNTTTNEAGEEVFVANTACQVPEKYQDAAIPMRCKGNFSDDPAKLCTLDFAGLLKAEAQRRINEKIDDKVGDKLKEKLGDQMGEDLGNKLKGLFGR